jgi:lipopolysaccharide transport system ATP-binding protein
MDLLGEGQTPALFHITHWKAGSQWVKSILRECFPNRFVDAQIGITKVRDFVKSPKSEGLIYPALYITKEQFDSMVFPKNWYCFVIIRDLRDTLISAYFSFKISHPLLSKYNVDLRDKLNSLDMDDGLLYLMDTWLHAYARIQESWLRSDFEVIRYEDLLTDDLMIFERILIERCHMPITKEELKEVVLKNRFESTSGGRRLGEEKVDSHLRKGIPGDWENYFNDNIKQAFIKHFGDLLIRTGDESGFDW